MSVSTINPFRPTRWEHQRDGFQLIWFTPDAEQLVGEKSIYVRGSRGSGKTTLLKSICWEDLAKNACLRMQKRLTDFGHIGIYIRFPDHLSGSLSEEAWHTLYPDIPDSAREFHRFFSLLIELTCLERAISACNELRLLDQIDLSAGQELKLVNDITREFPGVAIFCPYPPKTFVDLAQGLRQITRKMNEAAGRGTVRALFDQLPSREPGELLSLTIQLLANQVRIVSAGIPTSPIFKFCLDDCEILSPSQQKTLNTLVRVSKNPVSFVVSAVGLLFESTETSIPEQPLTEADRRIISLDERNEESFRELCQAVVSLRLLFSVSEPVRVARGNSVASEFFRLDIRLGNRDVNEMMLALADKSLNPLAKIAITAAKELRTVLTSTSRRLRIRYPRGSSKLPMYEAYVLLHWEGGQEAFKSGFSEADIARVNGLAPNFNHPAFEAWLRRKQRAALLHFAATLGIKKVPLGGAGVIIALADGSIRDFLEILGEIYLAYANRHKLDASELSTLDNFATSGSRIAWDIQSNGIYAASSAYLAGINTRTEKNSDLVMRLLEGLGRFTSLLQSNPDDPTTLGSAERGVMIVKFGPGTSTFSGDPVPDRERAIWHTIKQAELAGYLRTSRVRSTGHTEDDEGEIRARTVAFRLHRRFAPEFRFSFRGAYEGVTIPATDLWPLCDRNTFTSGLSWAESMAKRGGTGDRDQLFLPFSGVPQDA